MVPKVPEGLEELPVGRGRDGDGGLSLLVIDVDESQAGRHIPVGSGPTQKGRRFFPFLPFGVLSCAPSEVGGHDVGFQQSNLQEPCFVLFDNIIVLIGGSGRPAPLLQLRHDLLPDPGDAAVLQELRLGHPAAHGVPAVTISIKSGRYVKVRNALSLDNVRCDSLAEHQFTSAQYQVPTQNTSCQK